MLASLRSAPLPAHHDNDSVGLAGRITLGGRQFDVVLASGLPSSHAHDICRFEIDGVQLAVRPDHAPDQAEDRSQDLAARLTARELQVAVLVAQGHATKNIAYQLQISEWTVGTYIRRLFAKLGCDSRAAMVYHCAPLIEANAGHQRPRGKAQR
jgi:DNA-binding NarL/FixJ family response regulator